MDRVLYLRDIYDGEVVTVFLYDNEDGTYTPAVKLGRDSKLAVLDPSARPAPKVVAAAPKPAPKPAAAPKPAPAPVKKTASKKR